MICCISIRITVIQCLHSDLVVIFFCPLVRDNIVGRLVTTIHLLCIAKHAHTMHTSYIHTKHSILVCSICPVKSISCQGPHLSASIIGGHSYGSNTLLYHIIISGGSADSLALLTNMVRSSAIRQLLLIDKMIYTYIYHTLYIQLLPPQHHCIVVYKKSSRNIHTSGIQKR